MPVIIIHKSGDTLFTRYRDGKVFYKNKVVGVIAISEVQMYHQKNKESLSNIPI